MGFKKKALIAGLTGQDGSYLAEILLDQGYMVFGLTRDKSLKLPQHLHHLSDRVEMLTCDYTPQDIQHVLSQSRPDEVYNFAAQTYVSKSWSIVQETIQNSGLVPVYFLEAILSAHKHVRFFQASSSEIFTPMPGEILNEDSRINPTNPYGASKAFAHQMVTMFRRQYGLYAVNGILFNHESSRRKDDFVSKKIVKAAVAIKLGKQQNLVMGSLAPVRDWGYAGDFADAIYRMMKLANPVDLIVSTGRKVSVEDMVRTTFDALDLDWKKYVVVDPSLVRPLETPVVVGSNEKIKTLTQWKPRVTFEEMMKSMIASEMKNQQEQV